VIEHVTADNRRSEFRVVAKGRDLLFPYSRLRVQPSSNNPIVSTYVDAELGNQAFTYCLASGDEDSIHLDAVLEVNGDPEVLQHALLHQLTVEAITSVDHSGLGIRQIARMMRTSPTQVYRLLNPAIPGKSLGQLVYLLHLVGKKVDVAVSDMS